MSLRAAMALGVTILVSAGPAPARVEEPVPALEASALLEEVLAPYRQLEGLHYRAHYSFTFRYADGSESQGESSAAYWASPVGFRSETEVDRRLVRAGFMGGTIITFDGLESRILFRDQQTLSLKRGESPDFSLTPNPVFLPIDFVKGEKLYCEGCRATLADLRSSGPATDYIPGSATVVPWMNSTESVLVAFPDGDGGGRKEVILARWRNTWFVAEVVHRDAGGAMTSVHRFSFPTVPPGAPAGLIASRTVVSETWSRDGDLPNGAVHMKIRGELTELDLTPRFDWPEFSIPVDTDLAQTVIDDDSGTILRAGSCKVPLPERPDPFAAP